MRAIYRPRVDWTFTDPKSVRLFLESLGPDRIVNLYDDDSHGPFEMTIRGAINLIRHWINEEDQDAFYIHSPRDRWDLYVDWEYGTLFVSGLLASWRPENADFVLDEIGERGKGALERIPAGLPEDLYDTGEENEGRLRSINRLKPEKRLAFFKATVYEEAWVEGNRIATRKSYLGPGARPMGGEELQAWAAEDPDALVDVQPGEEGQNLFPRREVLAMIWEHVKET